MEHKCKKTDIKTIEKCELNREQERITKNLNNELYDYVKRIVAAVKYNGEGDHEDVPSILKKFAKIYEQRIKELAEKNERLQCHVNRLKKYDEERDIALHARLIAETKADTVREFAVRLIKHFDKAEAFTEMETDFLALEIDQIAKEMLEEKQ